MLKYIAKEGDMLDWIVWRHYGTTDVLERVMEANPNVNDYKLGAGVEVKLPYISSVQSKSKDIRLWN